MGVSRRKLLQSASAAAFGALVAGRAPAQESRVTIYSGRAEGLVGPLLKRAEETLGMEVQVRYGDTAQMGLAILEEGPRTRADVFLAQDPGALGALGREQRLQKLPGHLLDRVDRRFRSPKGVWIGLSARTRVVDYNTRLVRKDELPKSIFDVTAPRWKGKTGWAPANGSFQAFVTAMRLADGEKKAAEWLRAMKANGAQAYPNNSSIVEALGRGEIHLGLVNNYYLTRFTEQNPQFPVAHHYTKGDVGSLALVAGAGITDAAGDRYDAAVRLLQYLLSPAAQTYFAEQTGEYPLLQGVAPPAGAIPLEELDPPEIDLSDLDDLAGTMELLNRTGVL